MVTQTFKQGTHEIKIESAESIEDAKKNNFPNGIYSRYFLDGKLVENYSALMRFIIEKAKTENEQLIPDEKDLIKTRNDILKNQAKETTKHLKNMKEQYKKSGVSEEIIAQIDNMIGKLDPFGVRVFE